ncbi:hypothetical protein KFK09_023437 [Dendrobium nobile]|uniref:Uncharacterized protein n=1 Tax=Dendrobium nobile TaxID=94219 RepID=A0A8T3AL23_DENNO|nr:hypothetical protein KFK09_023437 [Dendrobium nobile]
MGHAWLASLGSLRTCLGPPCPLDWARSVPAWPAADQRLQPDWPARPPNSQAPIRAGYSLRPLTHPPCPSPLLLSKNTINRPLGPRRNLHLLVFSFWLSNS